MKNKITWFLFFAFFVSTARAQVIPDSLRAEWSYAGLQNFYVDTNNIVDVTTFGAMGNGTTNDYPSVLSAINSLGGSSGIVYFPPGNYLLNSTINLPDSVVLKGASSTQTTLTFNLGGVTGNCINVWASQSHLFYPVQSGYQKGSFKILCDSAMNFSAGDYAELRQQNGTWDTNPATWADYAVGQMLTITATDGDTLFLQHPLRIDYDSALNVEIRKVNMRSNVSVQCLHIVRTDSTATSVNYGISFYYAANCLVRGVEIERTIGSLIIAEFSTALEITGSYFHHAYDYSGTSTKGYGVTVASHTGECKIENNIFRHLRHAMSVKQGANGNVYSYNYSIEPTRVEFPTDLGGDISLHGHYAFSNLFEGNICQNLIIDQAWGPSGPFNTFFRNRVELYGIVISSGTVNTDRNNFVGNDITGTGSGHGQYILPGATHFTYGNNDNGVIQPPGTNVLNDTTYYLNASPTFWNITESFPNIGTPNPVIGQNIPARERYLSGSNFTVCGPDVINVGIIPANHRNNPAATIYPNPVTNVLRIENAKSGIQSVDVYDVVGEKILHRSAQSENKAVIDVRTLPAGIYFITVKDEKNNLMMRKIVKM